MVFWSIGVRPVLLAVPVILLTTPKMFAKNAAPRTLPEADENPRETEDGGSPVTQDITLTPSTVGETGLLPQAGLTEKVEI